MTKKDSRVAKIRKADLAFRKAAKTTMANVLDNVVAAGGAGFAVDLVLPTIGNTARFELLASVLVLFFVTSYVRK